jgi:hypothetical protein
MIITKRIAWIYLGREIGEDKGKVLLLNAFSKFVDLTSDDVRYFEVSTR